MVNRDVPFELSGDKHVIAGLTTKGVLEQRSRYGLNDILTEERSGWNHIARDTARDPMLWFLAFTSSLFFAVGDITEGTIMALAIVPILGMDAYLHRRTLASTASLAIELSPSAVAIRDGTAREIAAIELVPGDLVVVKSGQSFPADGRIVQGDGLLVDESTLTGESVAVSKSASALDVVSVPEHGWVMAGTRLLTGKAHIQLIATGAATAYGQIIRTAHQSAQQPTELQNAANRLVLLLSAVAVLMCGIVALASYRSGHSLLDATISAATLAVAALPEEFPVVLSFFVGTGVFRMARQKALVRRAVAVENIGRVTCICTDKTGTITEGKLQVAKGWCLPGSAGTQLKECLSLAVRKDSGDPLDLALALNTPESAELVVAVFPFTESRRKETIVRQTGPGHFAAALKGAPETVLAHCKLSARQRLVCEGSANAMAAQGFKVIAFASKLLRALPKSEPSTGFTFCGYIAFEDPVRPEVPEAIQWAKADGIKVILVTGDHMETARNIASKAGIGGNSPVVIAGAELARFLQAGNPRNIDVVARAEPGHKLDLVKGLQAKGETVVVTGDGVNDVPALAGADVGIAMGLRGSQAARETAAIVLLNDSFGTITAAIRQGREIFNQLRLSFTYLLLVHIPLVLSAALVPLLGHPTLFMPVHVVVLELIMHPTAILGFQQNRMAASAIGSRKAISNHPARLFSRSDALLVAIGGLMLAAAVVGGYLHALSLEGSYLHGRALGLATLVIGSSLSVVTLTGGPRSGTTALAVIPLFAIALALQFPQSAQYLQMGTLHASDWLLAFAAGIPPMLTAHLVARRVLRF